MHLRAQDSRNPSRAKVVDLLSTDEGSLKSDWIPRVQDLNSILDTYVGHDYRTFDFHVAQEKLSALTQVIRLRSRDWDHAQVSLVPTCKSRLRSICVPLGRIDANLDRSQEL